MEYKWFRNYYTPSKAEDKEQHCTGSSRQSVGLRSWREQLPGKQPEIFEG
jgi:hypothetical protein